IPCPMFTAAVFAETSTSLANNILDINIAETSATINGVRYIMSTRRLKDEVFNFKG
ncbi:9052_t:CDS:1, partial [Paraglomus occultum]